MQSNFDTEFDVGSLGFVRTLRASQNNSEAQRNIYMMCFQQNQKVKKKQFLVKNSSKSF